MATDARVAETAREACEARRMAGAACSFFHSVSVSVSVSISKPKRFHPFKSPLPSTLSFSFSSSKSDFSRYSGMPLNPRQVACSSFSSPSGSDSSVQKIAVLLEVEGVLMDVYRLGNHQAFNSAFQKLGLDCANWTEPIYLDLKRKTGGDEKRMLILFFNKIGWPTSLPTNEKEKFVESVLLEKENALEEIVAAKHLPLRPGVESFIDEVLYKNIPVVALTAYSKHGEKMARSIVDKLGQERTAKIKIVGKEEVEHSFYGQLVLGEGVSSSLEEKLAKEAKRAASVQKQRIAEEVASVLKLSVAIPSESLEKVVATLRAAAEFAGFPVNQCVLIAGGQSGVLAAENISMPCVVIRSRMTMGAEFPLANAVMDGFGGGDLTLSKLIQKLWT